MSKNTLLDNKFLNILFETTPDMLSIMDKNGKILQCNNPCAKNLGYEKEELIGMIGPLDCVSEKDSPRAVTAFNKIVTDGIALDIPLDMVRKDKSIFPSIWSGAVLKNDSGNIEGYLVTGKDLTVIYELKNDITQLKIQNRKEKLSVIGELSVRLAHDIKNPLSVIRVSLDALKMKYGTDEKTQKTFERIERSIDRITHQINEVMDFVRQKPLVLTNYGFLELLNNSIDSIVIPNSVKILIPKDDFIINCDPVQIRIVFSNIILNGIQAMKDNGEISISASNFKEFLKITFSDSGKPIPEDSLSKIFEPLYTTKQEGTGLGLASCRTIIEHHGGTIQAKNNPKRFEIILPKPENDKS